jgi:hypothetical protein
MAVYDTLDNYLIWLARLCIATENVDVAVVFVPIFIYIDDD